MAKKVKTEPEYYLPIYLPRPLNERGPCPRNREIHQAVRIGQMSQRAAAEKFKLSVSRIGQIVKQVDDWIARTGGGPTRSSGERLRVSEYVHRERLETMYAQAQSLLNDGVDLKAVKVTMVDGKPDQRQVSSKSTKGDKHYLMVALRVETARMRFEDTRMHPPEPEEMTVAERVHEAGLIAAETYKQILEQREKENAEREEAEAAANAVAEMPPELAFTLRPIRPPEESTPVVESPAAQAPEQAAAAPQEVPPETPKQEPPRANDFPNRKRESPPITIERVSGGLYDLPSMEPPSPWNCQPGDQVSFGPNGSWVRCRPYPRSSSG